MFTLPSYSNLRTIEFGKHTIVKYEKPDATAGAYRSVVKYDDRIVSVSPPRSILFGEFEETFPWSIVLVDEFVEGTMVNAFFSDSWRICTKCNVGATNGFFVGAPCFADMFWEAAAKCGVVLADLDARYVYSFVVQHPKNRIVCPVELNLYLIKVYHVRGDVVEEMPRPNIAPTPPRREFVSYAAMCAAAADLPYTTKGFMLHSPDGVRSKIIGDAYARVSALRGGDASIKFRVLQMRGTAELDAMLDFYPEHRALAAELKLAVRKFTNDLYSMYIECYKVKSKPFAEFPYEFKQHLHALHTAYIQSWPTPIHKARVVEYVGELHAAQLRAVVCVKT